MQVKLNNVYVFSCVHNDTWINVYLKNSLTIIKTDTLYFVEKHHHLVLQ